MATVVILGGGVGGLVAANTLRQPSRLWHWAKVGFEKWWLRRWF